MTLQNYLVVSKLIEQSTWGGRYLLNHKGLDQDPALAAQKIGQTYELFSRSKLVAAATRDAAGKRRYPGFDSAEKRIVEDQTDVRAPYELGDADSDTVAASNAVPELTLAALIATDPEAVLGRNVVAKYGAEMPLLLKMNQALGNSFQLHIKKSTESPLVVERAKRDPYATPEAIGGWLAKPETWYYFAPGKATLGLKDPADAMAYESCCHRIYARMQTLSRQIKAGEKSLADAQADAKAFIAEQDPWQYVNVVEVNAGEVIDLSEGGVHHSWEEDLEKFPDGNIVYEIQLDRMDTLATLRAFDQGKIKSDGSIRALSLEDYFKHLDTDPEANNVANHLFKPRPIYAEDGGGLYQLVENDLYGLRYIRLSPTYSTQSIATPGSFCHLFVKSGLVAVPTGESDGDIYLSQGWSYFMPAALADTMIGTVEGSSAEVLVSYVP